MHFLSVATRAGAPTLTTFVYLVSLLALERSAARLAQAESARDEHFLKAQYLCHFAGYVEWPARAFPTPDHPFVIGVLGTAGAHEHLPEQASRQNVTGRTIVIQHFPSLDAVRACHLLFVGRALSEPQERLLFERFDDEHVLIVGERPGFAHRGGCMNLVTDGDRVRVEVNLAAARQRQLKISSKLLNVVAIVEAND